MKNTLNEVLRLVVIQDPARIDLILDVESVAIGSGVQTPEFFVPPDVKASNLEHGLVVDQNWNWRYWQEEQVCVSVGYSACSQPPHRTLTRRFRNFVPVIAATEFSLVFFIRIITRRRPLWLLRCLSYFAVGLNIFSRG